MNKLSLLGVAGFALTTATSALAADLPTQMPTKATFQQRFTWTGCYMGAHAGGVWTQTSATDPVLLVQDNAAFGLAGNTIGTTTANVRQSGAVIGGQIGCDYQFSPNFVVGIEGPRARASAPISQAMWDSKAASGRPSRPRRRGTARPA